jgi:DNA polymerase-3 subunit chi
MCCEIFDGRDEDAVTAARSRWKSYKDAGHTLAYYQQNDMGRWEQKQ